MRKLQLLIATYYLQIFWHDMNLKLTLGTHFDKWFYQLDHVFFLEMHSGLQNAHCFLPDLLHPNFIFLAGVKVDISSKKLHTKNYL